MSEHFSEIPIGKDECEGISFDNRSKMGPDSNQENTGTCWAHASAALIEEQLCLAHPQYCGKRVARTYLIGKTQGIDFFSDSMLNGDDPETLLYYFISPSGGNFNICLDSYNRNPFDLKKFNYPEYLREEYYLIKMKQRKEHCLTQLERHMEPLVGSWEKLLDFLKTDGTSPSRPNHYLNREAFEQLAKESNSPEEFVQKVLLSPCAQATQQVNFRRDPEQHLASINLEWYDKSKNQVIIEAFRDAKSFQHSVLLTICHQLFLARLLKLNTNDECGKHAVVANAVK